MSLPGAAEEAGKATNAFMEIMKGQPLSLALAIMNVSLLVIFFFILNAVAEQRKRELQLFYDDAKSVREQLIQRCSGTQPKTNSLLRLYPPPATLPIGLK